MVQVYIAVLHALVILRLGSTDIFCTRCKLQDLALRSMHRRTSRLARRERTVSTYIIRMSHACFCFNIHRPRSIFLFLHEEPSRKNDIVFTEHSLSLTLHLPENALFVFLVLALRVRDDTIPVQRWVAVRLQTCGTARLLG